MTRLRLDMMISRHTLTAIAIPSLRSLQIWVVPPKQAPQIKGFVFYRYNTDSPVTRLRLDTMVSRHALTAIAIPSLRSLQIWVVPPKQAPQIEGFVSYRYNTDSPVTRLCLDTMVSRHALTAIAIPSLRSLQIRVVPPKQTPQIGELVFYYCNTDSPSDAIVPRYDVISASPNGNRYSVAPLLTNPGGASKTSPSNRGVCFLPI